MLKRIAIASLLKPVNDTRMYEKIGISLSNTNKYEVNIIGFYSKKNKIHKTLHFYPLFNFGRLSLKRLWAPLKYVGVLLKVKPEIIIVTTAELLPVTVLYKIIFPCKIIYDVQENYAFNIRFNHVYPNSIKSFLAKFVRTTEIVLSSFVDYFFLAEECYRKELPFIGNRFTVLSNKYKEPMEAPIGKRKKDKMHFIYTGTIARNYGILEAIHFIKLLYELDQTIYFTIAGHCAQKTLLKEVVFEIEDAPYIELIGGQTLVPHEKIISLVKVADFGLIPYQPDPSIENKIPTKLYEYLANQLPIIIQEHEPWLSYTQQYNAAIALDFRNFNPAQTLQSIYSTPFYKEKAVSDVTWDSEEKKLVEIIKLIEGD